MKKSLLIVVVVLFVSVCAFAKTQIRVSGWGNTTEEAALQEMVDVFNASQDEIEAVWEPIPDFSKQIKVLLSAGTAPDVFFCDIAWFPELAGQNAFLPLDLYIKKENYDVEAFYTPLVDAFKMNGRLYGLPKDFSTLSLFYNKAIFDQYDVEYPEGQMSWDRLLEICEEFKSKGYDTPLTVAADFNRVIPFIKSNGGELVTEDLNTAITEPAAREGIEFYCNLVNRYQVAQEPANVGGEWIGDAFGKEKVAMAMTGPWTLGVLREQFPNVMANTGVVEMPMQKEPSTMIYTVSWTINRNTQHKEAAWELLKFMTDAGQQIFVDRTGVLASRKSIADNDTDPMKKAFYDGAAYGTPWSVPTPSGVFAEANDQINSRLKDLFYGKITYDQAFEEIKDHYMSWVTAE
ncbi:MAG TPA: ABC transporter substrate-binding protein [Thermotogota bacterium]|nr:ABC transporter substrate-binding protein [Thermotogota bacterium]